MTTLDDSPAPAPIDLPSEDTRAAIDRLSGQITVLAATVAAQHALMVTVLQAVAGNQRHTADQLAEIKALLDRAAPLLDHPLVRSGGNPLRRLAGGGQ